MLRYFYILLCTPLCFCYEYIDNQRFRKHNEGSKIETTNREKNHVQFDVASFLRNTATEKSQDYEPFAYKNKNREARTQTEYYFEFPFNENIEKRDEKTNYLNIDSDLDQNDSNSKPEKNEDKSDLNPQSFEKIAIENKLVSNRENNFKDKYELIDKDLIQNPEKKCAFKDMKVPFFSRKSLMAKEQKKKICIQCTRPYANNNALKLKENSKIKQLSNKIRMVYGDLCPKCIRNLLKRRSKHPENVNQIHSSREFYQNVVTVKRDSRYKQPIFENYYFQKSRLKKEKNKEQETQLKELEDVEMVNHVEVTSPMLNIVPLNQQIVEL